MVRSRVQSSIVARRDGMLKRTLLAQLSARLKRTIALVQRRVSDLRAHSTFRHLRAESAEPGR